MNTQTHILIGLAVAGKSGDGKANMAALLGGFMPDAVLYSLILWAKFVQGHDMRTIFDTLYYTPLWQNLMAVNNSFPLWIALFLAARVFKNNLLKAFCLAALVHLLFDFPFHYDDAHMHFWPLTDWVFRSPVSYWDPAHYGTIVSVLEGIGLVALAVYLWRIHENIPIRFLVAVLAPSVFLMHMFYMMAFTSF